MVEHQDNSERVGSDGSLSIVTSPDLKYHLGWKTGSYGSVSDAQDRSVLESATRSTGTSAPWSGTKALQIPGYVDGELLVVVRCGLEW